MCFEYLPMKAGDVWRTYTGETYVAYQGRKGNVVLRNALTGEKVEPSAVEPFIAVLVHRLRVSVPVS